MFKKMLIGLGVVVGVLVVVAVGGGLLIDSKLEVSTEQRIKRKPEEIYPLFLSVNGISAWWHDELQKMGVVVKKQSGPDQGVGMTITFESDKGKVYETWTLVEASAPTKVVYDVNFAGMMQTKRTISLIPGSFEGCDAHWNEVAHIGNPVFRWMTKMMNMKDVVENRNKALRALDTATLPPS
jgi:hypothetical protein